MVYGSDYSERGVINGGMCVPRKGLPPALKTSCRRGSQQGVGTLVIDNAAWVLLKATSIQQIYDR